MKSLYLLMMSAFVVTTATNDVALKLQGELSHVDLTNNELSMLHKCLCQTPHISCTLDIIEQTVNSTRSEPPQTTSSEATNSEATNSEATNSEATNSEATSSRDYLNVYMCTLYTAAIKCTRSQNSQKEATTLPKAKPFSLSNIETCDIHCVDVLWDDTVRNIMIQTDKISGELCASSSQDERSTTHIIITVVICVVVAVIISAIIAVFVRNKRRGQRQSAAKYIADSEKCTTAEVDKLPEQEKQHLYYEIDKDEPYVIDKDEADPQGTPQNTQPRRKNAYSKLRVKDEAVVNPYDILSGSDSQP